MKEAWIELETCEERDSATWNDMAKVIYEWGFMWLFYHAKHQVFSNTQNYESSLQSPPTWASIQSTNNLWSITTYLYKGNFNAIIGDALTY